MIRLLNPKYFMPFHGEYRMLKQHADVGIECGIPKENTFVLKNGDVLSIKNGVIKKDGNVPSGDVYIVGSRIGEIGSAVMKDRKLMSSDGIVVVIANIDTNNNKLLGSCNITSRGFVLIQENIEFLKELENISNKAINSKISKHVNYTEIKSEIVNQLTNYIYEKTGRNPIILPVIMDIKREASLFLMLIQ